MGWTDLSGAFGYGTKLTSAQMQNLRDNIPALAAGDSGAPRIVNAAITSGTITDNRLAFKAGDIRFTSVGVGGYYECLGADGVWRQCSSEISSSGGSTCFPAGSMVLMSNMHWRPIEHVRSYDLVYSVEGPARISKLDITNLGNRRMFRMADNSLLWSEEHSFWVKRGEHENIWTMNKEALINEQWIGAISGLPDFSKIHTGKEYRQEHFAYLDCFSMSREWKLNFAINVDEYNACKDLPLFLPVTENGELIVVNGYLVGACLNGFKTDYSKLRW